MAKHHLFLHLGPDPLVLDAADRTALADAGVQVPDVTDEQLEHARLEILRAHKAAGLKRKEVEGAWARVCRRVFRLRSDALLSVPGLAPAEAEQVALALDGLAGIKVHLVGTAKAPAAWAERVKAGRVHVLPAAGLGESIAHLALELEKRRLDKQLVTLKRRRKKVKKQLAA